LGRYFISAFFAKKGEKKMSTIAAIVFVFIIVGITMKYSLNKINKQNIIETIRKDNI